MQNVPTNRLIPVLVILLIVASFLLGSLYTKVQYYEKGGTAVAAAGTGNVAGTGTQPAAEPEEPSAPVNIDVTDYPRLGNKNAKVAIVEFTDYQCPFCERLFSDAFPKIKKEYIDTGKVQYMVRDFPLFQIHPQAQKAAEAANCAKDQNKFWEMHDKLFSNQSALQIEDLKKYAGELGLNAGTFNSCLDSGKYTDKIKKDQTDGEGLGVRGTPASFIGTINGNAVNGSQISGAVPFETFKATIDGLL